SGDPVPGGRLGKAHDPYPPAVGEQVSRGGDPDRGGGGQTKDRHVPGWSVLPPPSPFDHGGLGGPSDRPRRQFHSHSGSGAFLSRGSDDHVGTRECVKSGNQNCGSSENSAVPAGDPQLPIVCAVVLCGYGHNCPASGGWETLIGATDPGDSVSNNTT